MLLILGDDNDNAIEQNESRLIPIKQTIQSIERTCEKYCTEKNEIRLIKHIRNGLVTKNKILTKPHRKKNIIYWQEEYDLSFEKPNKNPQNNVR